MFCFVFANAAGTKNRDTALFFVFIVSKICLNSVGKNYSFLRNQKKQNGEKHQKNNDTKPIGPMPRDVNIVHVNA